MRLRDLLSELPGAHLIGAEDMPINSVSYDSRNVALNSIFVAITGLKVDGHDYIQQAVEAGASAVAIQADQELKSQKALAARSIPALVVTDTRSALARIAAALCGHPARKLLTIGVTGTDGKTSLAHLLDHVFSAAGIKAGLISTAECRVGDVPLSDTGRFTTPEAPELQQMLAQMVTMDCRWAVIEATSHGLALHRVDQCEYDIAVVTNIGSDHLDFHKTVEEYVAAKGRLFEMLDESVQKGIEKTAVLNADDPSHQYLRARTRAATLTYALNSPADITASELEAGDWTSRFLVHARDRETEVRMKRPGGFNLYNAVAATATSLAAGLDLDTIARGLESWSGAPGRMELVDEGQNFSVVVDFAHAPASLRRVLQFLRLNSRGRIIALFGCIGERDKDRRFAMGRVASEDADYTIVTDDNPYTEDRDAIIDDIAAGLRAAGKRDGHDFAIVPDRRQAIRQALAMAVDEDVVLLAGKGHEREVHLQDTSYECHDGDQARLALHELGHGAGTTS